MEWRAKSLVRESLDRDGEKLRCRLQGRFQNRVRNRVAGDGFLHRLFKAVGSASRQGLTPSTIGEQLGRIFIVGLILLILSAIAVALALLLWIALEFAIKIVLGVIILVGLFVLLRALTSVSS
jgi:hypothetical protein